MRLSTSVLQELHEIWYMLRNRFMTEERRTDQNMRNVYSRSSGEQTFRLHGNQHVKEKEKEICADNYNIYARAFAFILVFISIIIIIIPEYLSFSKCKLQGN